MILVINDAPAVHMWHHVDLLTQTSELDMEGPLKRRILFGKAVCSIGLHGAAFCQKLPQPGQLTSTPAVARGVSKTTWARLSRVIQGTFEVFEVIQGAL